MKPYFMDKQVLPGLSDFIVNFCQEMNIKNIDIKMLDLGTSIDLDLNIFDVFVSDFSQRFDMNKRIFDRGVGLNIRAKII